MIRFASISLCALWLCGKPFFEMNTGFDTTKILTEWQGGDLPDLLPAGFEFWWNGRKYRHRPGGYTDGMSSPQFSHLIKLCAPRGWAFPAAVAHDGGYHDAIERQNALQSWVPITFTKDECDQLFHDLLETLADTVEKQALILPFYEAVRLAGQPAFNEARQQATGLNKGGHR